MEVHAAHGSIVFIEAIYESSHAIVPQLDHARVQRSQDPWSLGVERQSLDAVRLGLQMEIDEHRRQQRGGRMRRR